MRYTITTLTEGKVLVTELDDYTEAWETFMALGRLPGVKHVALEPVAVKSAWKAGARAIEEKNNVRNR